MGPSGSIRIATCFVLVAAALNALSYFFWSEGWGNLFGSLHDHSVGIGFPFLIWHNGYRLPEPAFLPVNLFLNIGLAILAGAVTTWIVRSRSPSQFESSMIEPVNEPPAIPFWQLSICDLMAGTAVLAVVFGASGRSPNMEIGALKAIYIAGPITFAWIAWIGRKLSTKWQSVLGLGPAIAMIVAAGWLAESIPDINDFTRGLMGIFVCWIPQIVAFLLIDLVRLNWFSRTGNTAA